MFYQAYQIQSDMGSPWRLMAQAGSALLGRAQRPGSVLGQLSASLEVFSHLRLTHTRPPYAIDTVDIAGVPVAVHEEVVLRLPFATLLHMRRDLAPDAPRQPAVLVAAPLSGHFATLLRDTVRTLLQDHEVYITDWHNARDVSLQHGAFALDDYIDYLMRFLQAIGPRTHMLAVCQPCVAALAAAAVLAEDASPFQPRSLTLMAGPVDCRVNPTSVNALACSKPLEWFDKNLISRVPLPHRGFMRRVYPGFVQLSAFMGMNPERHRQAFKDWYAHLCNAELEQASAIQNFYDEYLAVNDLPAEFYLETVGKVFQTCDLAVGNLYYRGRLVRPEAMRATALLTVEGERDDICAVGQTMAAHDLCSGLRPYMKAHHVQAGVGHYGVFSGRKWKQQIYPRVRDTIYAHA